MPKWSPAITIFGHQNVTPTAHVTVAGNRIQSLNHLICYLISCPVFPTTLAIPL
jgi:hypothetical protein